MSNGERLPFDNGGRPENLGRYGCEASKFSKNSDGYYGCEMITFQSHNAVGAQSASKTPLHYPWCFLGLIMHVTWRLVIAYL